MWRLEATAKGPLALYRCVADALSCPHNTAKEWDCGLAITKTRGDETVAGGKCSRGYHREFLSCCLYVLCERSVC